jgi:hypothetical protein
MKRSPSIDLAEPDRNKNPTPQPMSDGIHHTIVPTAIPCTGGRAREQLDWSKEKKTRGHFCPRVCGKGIGSTLLVDSAVECLTDYAAVTTCLSVMAYSSSGVE